MNFSLLILILAFSSVSYAQYNDTCGDNIDTRSCLDTYVVCLNQTTSSNHNYPLSLCLCEGPLLTCFTNLGCPQISITDILNACVNVYHCSYANCTIGYTPSSNSTGSSSSGDSTSSSSGDSTSSSSGDSTSSSSGDSSTTSPNSACVAYDYACGEVYGLCIEGAANATNPEVALCPCLQIYIQCNINAGCPSQYTDIIISECIAYGYCTQDQCSSTSSVTTSDMNSGVSSSSSSVSSTSSNNCNVNNLQGCSVDFSNCATKNAPNFCSCYTPYFKCIGLADCPQGDTVASCQADHCNSTVCQPYNLSGVNSITFSFVTVIIALFML